MLITVAADVAVLWERFDEVQVDFPSAEDGTDTWLLVGSDDRRFPPAGDSSTFGTTDTVPTRSADVVVLYQRDDDGGTRLLGLNRDLVLDSGVVDGRPTRTRLGPVLDEGEQALIDLLCSSLGVAVDHVVVVTFSAFVALVDAVGGIEISIDQPVRDVRSGLLLERAGEQRLDGSTALAWVRSRFPEVLANGVWVPTGPTAGERPERGLVLLAALARELAAGRTLVNLHDWTWSIGPAIRIDDETGLRDLATFLGNLGGGADVTQRLPVRYDSVEPVPIARLAPEAREVLDSWQAEAPPCIGTLGND